MKVVFIILIAADIIFTMFFLPWGMLFNALIMIASLLILIPLFYYRFYIRHKK